MALYGIVGEFKESEESWIQYVEWLEQYFLANEITDGKKQRAILLSVCGSKTYGLLRDILQPKKPGDTDIKVIVEELKKHYNPKPSEIVERFKFHSRVRKEGESVALFVPVYATFQNIVTLVSHWKTCCVIVLCGVNNHQIQKRLLAETVLNFQKAVELALAMESASRSVGDLHMTKTNHANSARSTEHVDKVTHGKQALFGKKNQECYRCGGDHEPSTCKFKDAKCYSCQKKGHTAKKCRNRKKDQEKKPFRKDERREQKSANYFVKEEEGAYTMYHVTGDKNKAITIDIDLCGTTQTMELDIGASKTILNHRTYSELLSGLCTTKATGPDGISATLLRECATELAPSLTELFAMSLAHGKVPSEWKRANVVPVPKNDDPSENNNYRPISLLCIISKVLEHIVHRQVYEFIKPSLYDLQHGFRPNRSCITQLLEVLQDIGKNLDSEKTTDVVYLDFSKAFDSVSHPNLIQKLRDHGISGPLLNWFCDYLSSRKQRVVIDGVSSSFLEVTSGVPQGSVVGPLLFIIYVNEIPNETTHSKTPMFADDSKCYRQITSTDDEQLLQRDINSLQEWSVKWELSFNVQKCSVMRFTRKKNVMPADYHLANEEIKCVNIQKDLGIFISDDLKWSNQIAHVVAKANRMLGFLRRHCRQLTNIHCRRLLYLTLVRSHLSYGSEIGHPKDHRETSF